MVCSSLVRKMRRGGVAITLAAVACGVAQLPMSCASAAAGGTPLTSVQAGGSSAAVREYGVFSALQYYGPPLSQQTYDRVAAASKLVPLYVTVCADHNDTGGGAEHRTGDPGDGGRIVPICDMGDAEGAEVRQRLTTLRAAGAHVLHYAHTRVANFPNGSEQACCECCEDLPYVLGRVANETANFPKDGIMVDNVIANDLWLPYYSAIVKHARLQDPSRKLAMNINCAHDYEGEKCSKFCTHYGHSSAMCADCRNKLCTRMGPEWFELNDVVLLSEATAGTHQAPDFDVQLPFEPNDAQRSKMAMVTYGANASSWRGIIDRAKSKGFSKFWVDGMKGGNRTSFLTLPPWYEEMVQYIADMNTQERRNHQKHQN